MQNNPFTFTISLSVLDQLGRKLYRNFITILGEAISNSWDADATNVWIEIHDDYFVIKDDGVGMNRGDFQNKFLKIGYSKRKKGGVAKSKKRNRPFIGRKGIGKLALLSCAEKVSILTKTEKNKLVGGVIVNSELDICIKDDIHPDEYPLREVDEVFLRHMRGYKHGTIIRFDNLKNKKIPTESFLRKAIALHFRFSLVDRDFHIHLNNKEVTIDDLGKLIEKTQFLWDINRQKNDKFFKKIKEKAKKSENMTITDLPVRGFVASVIKPSDLNIFGADLKIGVDFYVNGRFRESNLLRGVISTQHVASYLYGQIHYDEIDNKQDDPFTTNREGVRSDNHDYEKFMDAIKGVLNKVGDRWDDWRREINHDGDPENIKILSKYQRKMEESRNARVKDFEKKINLIPVDKSKKERLKDRLKNLSSRNMEIYQDLFILENLFREYLKIENLRSFDSIRKKFPENEAIEIILSKAETFAQKGRKLEEGHDLKGKIRENKYDINYFDLIDLGVLIGSLTDKKSRVQGMEGHTKEIYPIRNAVMHTNEVTKKVMDWNKIKNLVDMVDKMIEGK